MFIYNVTSHSQVGTSGKFKLAFVMKLSKCKCLCGSYTHTRRGKSGCVSYKAQCYRYDSKLRSKAKADTPYVSSLTVWELRSQWITSQTSVRVQNNMSSSSNCVRVLITPARHMFTTQIPATSRELCLGPTFTHSLTHFLQNTSTTYRRRVSQCEYGNENSSEWACLQVYIYECGCGFAPYMEFCKSEQNFILCKVM